MASLRDIEELLARCALGDRAAFRALYDATSAKLFGVCLRVLNNRAEAEEALQEAYIRIWQRADRYAADGRSPMTWLITVTRNIAIDRLRARRVPTDGLDDVAEPEAPDPSPEASAIARSEARRILSCLEEMDPERAEAVRAAYLDGWRYKDLAAHFGVPLNTMRTWLRRSLLALRECLNR